jgi:hypothetical protein
MRFERATGAPIKPEDAAIIGRELLRIATAHRIQDVRAVSKHIVLEEVLADANNPMRPFYNWDVNEAAHAHWLERTQVLINSIRIVEAGVRPKKPRKMFVSVNDTRETDEDGQINTHKGMRLLAPDAARNNDIFVQYLETCIGRIAQALQSAEDWAERGNTPARHQQLLRELREALSRYNSQ